MKSEATKAKKKLQHEAPAVSLVASVKPATNKKYNLDAADSRLDSKPREVVVIPKDSGLTLHQWRDLSVKDAASLTILEKRQLEATNKMMADMLKDAGSTATIQGALAVFNAVEPVMLSIAQLNDDVLKSFESVRRVMIPPIEALASLQKGLIAYQEVTGRALVNIANAALAASSMFEGFQTFHERITRSLSVDISSLADLTRLSDTESIKFSLGQVTRQDGHIFVTTETRQERRIPQGYVFVSYAQFNLVLTELKATRSEVAELKNVLQPGANVSASGNSRVEFADVTFKREDSFLILKEYQVPIRKISKQARFCALFFQSEDNFAKKWDLEDFAVEAYGLRLGIDTTEDDLISLIKGYVHALNAKIAIATKGNYLDFFILLGADVFINRKYLSNA